jgi:predicted RNA-binding Zn-ribbon protein involved in translation (DUF1610 family)
MEDIITNFELVGTRLLRICPTCGELQDKAYDLRSEQAVLREQCPKCGFHFPYMTEKPSSFAVFKDLVITPPEDSSNGAVKNPESVDDLPSIPN